jgi:hypothetical protein
VLEHRVELAPGIEELTSVLEDAMREPLERLARSTMQRR